MMRRGVVAGLAVAVVLGAGTTRASAEPMEAGKAFTKFTRGGINIVTGWVEIPKRISETSQESGTAAGFTWGAAAWLTHVAAYILLNSAVNSLGHTIGYRNYRNQATNLQWLAFMTGGEGLHNNHHEYPTSARFALKGREIDLAWPVIRLLEAFGLAKVNPLPIAKAA